MLHAHEVSEALTTMPVHAKLAGYNAGPSHLQRVKRKSVASLAFTYVTKQNSTYQTKKKENLLNGKGVGGGGGGRGLAKTTLGCGLLKRS
jgi:hypothetical protein